ncbi:hypothetical protein BELL_0224g00160 [Botrytis elliptica]|uniref:Uncharacterized protein n=1 Tax=Botrytis elliptica TaxID=278938 RepID=A0A4Z1JNR4_9HELO|nr:hypothetical protein EAE99_003854 [Botrytis elliptica]TGO75265.1 hypothetical protein BELL_0224g00160 [Botrytis elliptica]
MNAQQELETAGIIGATIVPGNPVTVIHQQHVSPALFNRIKNLELSNKALKYRVLAHESTIASLDHNLKAQAWRVHALELNQQNQNAVIQSYDMAQKSCDMQIATLKSYESWYDTQFKTQHILRSTQDEKIQLLEDRLKMYEDGFMNKTSTCIQSIGLDLKSQKLKIENQERKLDEKLARYEFVLMENQKRELSEKFASYEAVLIQKVKKSILANLIGSETEPSDDIGVKNEPRTKGS